MKCYIDIDSHKKSWRDEGDYADWGATTEIEGITLCRKDGGRLFPLDSVELVGDAENPTVYVPVVRYHDGDTFGSSRGNVWTGTAFTDLGAAQQWDPNTFTFSKYDRAPWDDYFAGDRWDEIDMWKFEFGAEDEATGQYLGSETWDERKANAK